MTQITSKYVYLHLRLRRDGYICCMLRVNATRGKSCVRATVNPNTLTPEFTSQYDQLEETVSKTPRKQMVKSDSEQKCSCDVEKPVELERSIRGLSVTRGDLTWSEWLSLSDDLFPSVALKP